jgi:hypothetical protein
LHTAQAPRKTAALQTKLKTKATFMSMDEQPTDTPKNSKHPMELAGQFTLVPMGMHKIELGKYREADPKPKFRIYYGPHETHSVTRHESKLGDGEVYYLFYQFQNFDDKPCEITIRRVEPDQRINA